MLRRTYLGVDITADSLRAVALRRGPRGHSLLGARVRSFEEALIASSVREPNILQPELFVARLQELLKPLAGREDRIALSVADVSGHVLLTEVETPFKTRAEGIEILKWQLRNELPGDLADIQLDYQLLGRTESGRQRLIVALMDRRVLDQYQDLVAEAGYHAVTIGFHSFNLYNFYRPRHDMGEDFVFVGVEDGFLNFKVFQEKALVYHRFRHVGEDAARVFRELNRSLAGFPGSPLALRRTGIFLHCSWSDPADVREATSSVFEKEPFCLNPHLEHLSESPSPELDQQQGLVLTAALGAAEQMM